MTRPNLRRLLAVDANTISEALGTRQYLQPLQPLGAAIEHVRGELRFCSESASRGIDWLQFDRNVPIGRLRRSELIQLAKSIHRFWREPADSKPVQSS